MSREASQLAGSRGEEWRWVHPMQRRQCVQRIEGESTSARARDVSVGSENEEDGRSCGVRQSWDLRLSGHSKECEKPPSHPRV